MNEMQLRLEM